MPKNLATVAAEGFDPSANVAEYQQALAYDCATYTQCEYEFNDGSILEFHKEDGEPLAVRTYPNRNAFEKSGKRPDRPHRRVGLKKTGGQEVIIRED